jgi:hypothetical protein
MRLSGRICAYVSWHQGELTQMRVVKEAQLRLHQLASR